MQLNPPVVIQGKQVQAIQLSVTITSIHTPGESRTAVSKIVHLVEGDQPNTLIPLDGADIEMSFVMDQSTPPALLPFMQEISHGIRGLLETLYGYKFEEI